jgi:hypothetical protein
VLTELTDILVTTTDTAIGPFYYVQFPAKMIIIDEGSRLSEMQMASLAWRYQDAIFRLIAGDEWQLQPYTEVLRGSAIFGGAANVSALSGMVDAGYTTAHTTDQYRCNGWINSLLCHLAYKYQEMSNRDDALTPKTEAKTGDAFREMLQYGEARIVG